MSENLEDRTLPMTWRIMAEAHARRCNYESAAEMARALHYGNQVNRFILDLLRSQYIQAEYARRRLAAARQSSAPQPEVEAPARSEPRRRGSDDSS